MSLNRLTEELESIRVNALMEAHRLYAERVEVGMNLMVQRSQQAANPLPASNPLPAATPCDGNMYTQEGAVHVE